MLRLQRTIGNRAVNALVQREFEAFSGVGRRVGGDVDPDDYETPDLPDTGQLVRGRPAEQESRRLQQLAALRARGLLGPSGYTFRDHQSRVDEHLDARDDARDAQANALQSYGVGTRQLREVRERRAQIDGDVRKALIIDAATIGPLDTAVTNRCQAADLAVPSARGTAVALARADLTTLEQTVTRVLADHAALLRQMTTAADNAKDRVGRATRDATFDDTELKRLKADANRTVTDAKGAASTIPLVQAAVAAIAALDSRATDDCAFADLIARAPGGLAALDSGDAFSAFRVELKQKGNAAWANFKLAVVLVPRVTATCAQHLRAATDFFVSKEDLAGQVKGSSDVKKSRAVEGLLALGPVKDYANEGADKYMVGQLLDKTPGKNASGADAQVLKRLLSVPNVTASMLLGWLTPAPVPGPEVPTVDENVAMLEWAKDGGAFAALRLKFAATLKSQLYVLLQRCQGQGPSLKYVAVDKNKDFAWLDELTQEHKASDLEWYLKNNAGQRFWRAGSTCAAPTPTGGSTIDQIIVSARQLTRNNRQTLRNEGAYVGNRSFGNRGTIDQIESNGDVTSEKCMALPTTRAGVAIGYVEYDLAKLTNAARGPLRFVVGTDGSRYYTDDHYGTFKRFKEPT